jgi:amino acid transporter
MSEGEKGQISLWGAVSIGVGGMVGGGIFAVLGLAVLLARGGTPLAFLIAGTVALLTSYSYARLSTTYPSSGGTVIFIDRAFGVDFVTGVMNNLLWISYVVMLALYAFAFGSYGATFFKHSHPVLVKHILISAAIIVPAGLNLLSAGIIGKAETYIVAVKVAILLFFIAAGFQAVRASRLAVASWSPITQLTAGGMIIFLAYEGFELIANTAKDIKDFKRNLPRAFYISVGFVVALYVVIAVVTVGSLPLQRIISDKDYALAAAARPALGAAGFSMIAVAAMLSTLSAINATIYGSARLSYVIAKEGELPHFIEDKVWNRPIEGLLITSVLALVLANVGGLSSISTMGSAGFLLIFAAVNAANFHKSKETGAGRWIAALGVAACLLAFGALCWYTATASPLRLLVLVGMGVLAGVIEGVYVLFKKEASRKGRIRNQ